MINESSHIGQLKPKKTSLSTNHLTFQSIGSDFTDPHNKSAYSCQSFVSDM